METKSTTYILHGVYHANRNWYNKMCIISIVCGLFLGCEMTTSPDTVVPSWIQHEWDKTAALLANIDLYPSAAMSPPMFVYVERPTVGVVDGCGVMLSTSNEIVYGQFIPPRTIYYPNECKQVVRHELGHAILYAMGNPWYFCWQHGELKESGYKRFQECPAKYLYPGRY